MYDKYIRTEKGICGELFHYDERGHLIGESRPGFIPGTYNHYDNEGYSGYSQEGLIAVWNHYGDDGHYIGSSSHGLMSTNHVCDDVAGSSWEDPYGADTYLMSTDYDY